MVPVMWKLHCNPCFFRVNVISMAFYSGFGFDASSPPRWARGELSELWAGVHPIVVGCKPLYLGCIIVIIDHSLGTV